MLQWVLLRVFFQSWLSIDHMDDGLVACDHEFTCDKIILSVILRMNIGQSSHD